MFTLEWINLSAFLVYVRNDLHNKLLPLESKLDKGESLTVVVQSTYNEGKLAVFAPYRLRAFIPKKFSGIIVEFNDSTVKYISLDSYLPTDSYIFIGNKDGH